QTSLALDAAAGGQGVALGRSALAASDLLAGRLVRPFGPSLPVAYAYYIVCPKAKAALRPRPWSMARVRSWSASLGTT
ncbi:MAG: LysR family transcriptional regulator, partial [Proteobacteria bacterium]|nr:LysR family transcriptional regulator [Pseudomonadota bacterium]